MYISAPVTADRDSQSSDHDIWILRGWLAHQCIMIWHYVLNVFKSILRKKSGCVRGWEKVEAQMCALMRYGLIDKVLVSWIWQGCQTGQGRNFVKFKIFSDGLRTYSESRLILLNHAAGNPRSLEWPGGLRPWHLHWLGDSFPLQPLHCSNVCRLSNTFPKLRNDSFRLGCIMFVCLGNLTNCFEAAWFWKILLASEGSEAASWLWRVRWSRPAADCGLKGKLILRPGSSNHWATASLAVTLSLASFRS